MCIELAPGLPLTAAAASLLLLLCLRLGLKHLQRALTTVAAASTKPQMATAIQTAQAVTLLSQTMLPSDWSYQPKALAATPSRKSTMAKDGKTMYRMSCY